MDVRAPSGWAPPVSRAQGGAFTRDQAIAAGLTRGAVDWRIRSGRWLLVAGVAYRLAADPGCVTAALHAAHLTWPDSVVALGTAARAHGLPVRDDGRVHVVLTTTRAPARHLVPHEIRLDPGDVVHLGPVAVTGRRRTIIDCLGRLPADEALDLLAWVSSRRQLGAEDLAQRVRAHPSRWGNVARRRAAERLVSGAMSRAEDRLHELLHGAGITGWRAGVPLFEHVGVHAQADVYFEAVRLVVEVDGRRAHGADQFQADRTRQNALIAAGCVVLRYTWSDLQDRPVAVVDQIRSMLRSLSRARVA
ncbi:MAG: endonuclease domain-containing protein [Cellulomonas sp.]|nr:endonuclease domain-containing protein [Cellulomonas sp.]